MRSPAWLTLAMRDMLDARKSAAHAAPGRLPEAPTVSGGPFGDMLRSWRRARGVSQLDLALSVGVSSRHLSFLESGRARPSRDMAHMIAGALLMPRSEYNALLLSAGFAPVFPASPLEAEAIAPFRAIIAQMMASHSPNPAMVCDRRWTILDANPVARLLLSALQGAEGEMNVIRMLALNPQAPEFVVNHAEVLAEMSGRIRLEALEAGADPELGELVEMIDHALKAYPATPAAPRRPLVPLILRSPSGPLSFLTAVAHFGTSEDVTVRDLRLELLFPADAATRAAIDQMAATAS